MNHGKRDKPYYSRHTPYSSSKRRRTFQHHTAENVVGDSSSYSAAVATDVEKKPSTVVVIGLPSECSVLDVKSRFEIYGQISRTRMDPDGIAYVTFRSHDGAMSAISAAKDPSFLITLHSKPVQVMWANDPMPKLRKDGINSKLVRAEIPLSRRGRGNKLGSAIVNPRDESNGNNENSVLIPSVSGTCFKGREIVAYDDIL